MAAPTADAKAAIAPAGDKQPLKAPGRERIDCLDGCCFALVLPIVVAHTARFGTANKALLKVLSQENVLVGGFFAILGYIAAYTSTKVGERKADDRKLAKPELYFWSRVMSYYPVHFLVSTIFLPMFVAIDEWYGTPLRTMSFRAFLNYSLLQAWFPKQAAIWNQPSWFLSALTFSNLAMPAVLKRTATLSKVGLQKLFYALTAVSTLQKLSFANSARFHEHNIVAKGPEQPLIWNMTRFHPISSLFEMVTGVVAARDVMLDTEKDNTRQDPMMYFVAAYGSLLLRATPFDFNDGLIRSVLFVPLYTKFLASLHRDCRSENPSQLTQLLRSAPMTKLGSLTFSMFLLHSPLGQLFYKRSVATKVFGGPMSRSFFPIYVFFVLLCSHLLNEYVIRSDVVQGTAATAAKWLAAQTEGMLQDRD